MKVVRGGGVVVVAGPFVTRPDPFTGGQGTATTQGPAQEPVGASREYGEARDGSEGGRKQARVR